MVGQATLLPAFAFQDLLRIPSHVEEGEEGADGRGGATQQWGAPAPKPPTLPVPVPFSFFPFFASQLKLDLSGKKVNNLDTIEGVCKFFRKGNCPRGNQCPFKHSRVEKTVVCKHWLRGLCKKGDMCEFLHEYNLKKMPECWFYSKYQECSNPECIYLHIDPSSKIKECEWYARGFCKHGPECRSKHVRRVLCLNYLAGFCPEGPNCSQGHAKYELPLAEGGFYDVFFRDTPAPRVSSKAAGPKKVLPPLTFTVDLPSFGAGPGGGGAAGAVGSGGAVGRPLESVTCYKCNETGHYANQCSKRRKLEDGTTAPA